MSSRARILHLTHEMAIGGTQQVITQLVTHLDGCRFYCAVACIDGELGELGDKLKSNGTHFHVLHRGSGFDLALVKSVRNILIKNEYDIVHCHQYTPFVYGFLASMFTGVKVVYTEHGRFHPDRYSWKRRLLNPFLGKFTNSIVAISAATKRALAHYEWFSSKQINVIYNGLEPAGTLGDVRHWRAQFGIPEGALVYGTIARFDPVKNIPMMINAFKTVYDSNQNTRLLLVGDGIERPALEKLTRKACIADAVIFTGFQQDTATLMSLIDIYLLSSYSEGTSMTLLEAMSSGTCSIVTRVGGNVELLDHQFSGVIVDSGDTAGLAMAMLALAADPDRCRLLGEQAADVFARHFSISKMIEQYSHTYDKVLGLR